MDERRTVGRVAQVWVYPVKSLAGTPVRTAQLGPQGLAGDRLRAVVDEDGRALRAKDAPGLAAVPGDDADPAALSAVVGRPVRLAPLPESPGAAPVHLVSRRAIDRAALGDVPEGCSAEDPRANLLVDLDGEEDERAWVGRTVQVGEVLLEITRTPKHCLGVYADVRHAGTVTVGDAVLL